jgi:hypothetical protein
MGRLTSMRIASERRLSRCKYLRQSHLPKRERHDRPIDAEEHR